MSPISQDEVDQATKEMTLGKYPGLDGFRTYFFHHCWSLVKEEVWKLLEDSRTYQYVLSALNASFISLTPKEDKETNPRKFRPTALCNVIYNLITKVIALRLNPLLLNFISL